MSETFQRQWSPPVGGGQTKQISDSDSPRKFTQLVCMQHTHTQKVWTGCIQVALESSYVWKEQLASLKEL